MRISVSSLAAALCLLGASVAHAQHDEAKLETQKLTDSLYFISGPGGNIALLVGKSSAFLVDDEVPQVTPLLKRELAKTTNKPIRYVFNTHWHFDHAGGNPVFGSDGAVIVAHDNVRKRLATGQFAPVMKKQIPPTPEVGLPVITFAQSLSFHLDGEEVDVFHVDPAHTDGDSIVYFHKANVIHTGDTYFSNGYPFIDLSSGGSSEGYLKAADRVLGLARADTRIIPGHGAVSDRGKLKIFRDMIATLRGRVQKLVAAGKSLADVKAAKPTADYDAVWGKGFMSGDMFTETLYTELAPKK